MEISGEANSLDIWSESRGAHSSDNRASVNKTQNNAPKNPKS